MTGQLQFDLTLAIKARDRGIRQVAANNRQFLDIAREVAKALCIAQGYVTSDDVRRECPLIPMHPNAWGAVFKDRAFRFTGQYRKSAAESRHAGMQRVWSIIAGADD